jgi:hypothetical protein
MRSPAVPGLSWVLAQVGMETSADVSDFPLVSIGWQECIALLRQAVMVISSNEHLIFI